MSKHKERNFGLDLVRAIAIGLVLISHFVKKLDWLGLWGVEIFFALSGYLIGQILWREYQAEPSWGKARISNFWQRRWYRTLPNYYLFLIVSLVFHAFYYGFQNTSWTSLLDFLWFGQDFTSRSGAIFGVSWSLCIEEWFYLTFPLVLLAFDRFFSWKKNQNFMATIITFVIVCGLLRAWLMYANDYAHIREITIGRLDAIGTGVLMAFYVLNNRIGESNRSKLAIGGLFLWLGSAVIMYLPGLTVFTGVTQVITLLMVPMGAALMLPLSSMIPAPKVRYRFIKEVVEKISLWSYSIYLSHIPILFTLYYLLQDYRENWAGNLTVKVIGLALTLFVSALIYRFFEIPTLSYRPKSLPRKNSKSLVKKPAKI